MKVTFTGAGAQTLPAETATVPAGAFAPTDPGSHWQKQAWHLYVSGTWSTGAGATSVQVQYSPDGSNVADASSRWFSPAALLISGTSGAVGATSADTWFEARARKFRFVLAGGDSGTSLTAEIV